MMKKIVLQTIGLFVFFLTAPVLAQVNSSSTGCEIVGATFTIDSSCGSGTTEFISSYSYAYANIASVSAYVPLDGDTGSNTWRIYSNQAPPCELYQVIIDLGNTIAVFDRATPDPGTPDSGPGVDGVVTVSGPVPSSSTNDTLWNDPSNQGDLYRELIINWNPGVFHGGGTSYYFTTDTDAVYTNTPPTADAGEDQSVYANDNVQLDGSGTSDLETESELLDYSWVFVSVPTGSNATLSGASSQTPTFVADIVGEYVIELTVTDQGCLSDSDQVIINTTKIRLCHVPPGNPENFHDIIINDNALQAHLNHGDSPGSCLDNCAGLCNDSNVCTIDYEADAETCMCWSEPRPSVDCDDSNVCTQDSCDITEGCVYDASVMNGAPCDDGNPDTTDDVCSDGTCIGTGATVVWTSNKMTFTKSDYADWTLEENQDRITSNVWITRGDMQGIFNAKTESSWLTTSPENTEWAYGSAANWESLTFQNWVDWHGWNPPSTVGQNAVLHLISEDIYIDIKFLSWTAGGGGGFSYERATAP